MRASSRSRWAFAMLIPLTAIAWVGSTFVARQDVKATPLAGGFEGPDRPAADPIPAVVHVSSPVSAQAAKTWLKLQQPIPIQFPQETPLVDVLKYIKAATQGEKDNGIPVYVDPVGLLEAEKTMQSPVTLDLDGVPVSTSLALMLKQLGLTYFVQNDGILVITSETSQSKVLSDPLPTLLDNLAKLRSEVAALRTEVATLRGEGPSTMRGRSGMRGQENRSANPGGNLQ